jgi:hypothetical protein
LDQHDQLHCFQHVFTLRHFCGQNVKTLHRHACNSHLIFWTEVKILENVFGLQKMDEDMGDNLLDELEGRTASALQKLPGADGSSDEPRELGPLDYVEEYAMLAVIIGIVLYFAYKAFNRWQESIAYSTAARQAEDSMRRTRIQQQAKFELESAQRREELARIEEERRLQRLEEMQAMQEGRSARKPEAKKGPGAADFRADGHSSTNPFGGSGGGSGGSGRYKPTQRQRRG